MFEMWSQCLPYQGELDDGFVADGEFAVARCGASGLFQEADPVLDRVPGLVFLAIEAGRAPAPLPRRRRCPTWSRFSGMVCGICRRRRYSRISREE